MILASHREPSECRADACSLVQPGPGRQPAGSLVSAGMPRRNQSPGPEIARHRLAPVGGHQGSTRRDRRRGHLSRR